MALTVIKGGVEYLAKTKISTDQHRRSGFDRRLGTDRRSLFNFQYLLHGKTNRRIGKERRQAPEQRDGWVRTGKWKRVCSLFIIKGEI